MKMFSKEHGANKFFLPYSYFEVEHGMRDGAVFLECEPVAVSAPPAFARGRFPNGNNLIRHMRQGMSAHEFVCRHVSGMRETLVG